MPVVREIRYQSFCFEMGYFKSKIRKAQAKRRKRESNELPLPKRSRQIAKEDSDIVESNYSESFEDQNATLDVVNSDGGDNDESCTSEYFHEENVTLDDDW